MKVWQCTCNQGVTVYLRCGSVHVSKVGGYIGLEEMVLKSYQHHYQQDWSARLLVYLEISVHSI